MSKRLWTPTDPLAVARGDVAEAKAMAEAEAEETRTLQRQVGELMSWLVATGIAAGRGEITANVTDRRIRMEIPNPKALGIEMKGWRMRTEVRSGKVIIEIFPATEGELRSQVADALDDGTNVW